MTLKISAKTLLNSLTAKGALIAGVPAIDQLLIQFGFTSVPVLAPAVAAGITLVGVAVAVWGRVRATQKIVKLW